MSCKVAPPMCACTCSCSTQSSRHPSAPVAASASHYHHHHHPPQQQHQQHKKVQQPPPPYTSEPLALLQLKVRALDKYKSNYELLCSQLEELNAQIGLQLEQHEADVSTLNDTIAQLRAANRELESALHESQALLAAQQLAAQQDRAYSERVHSQLATATELLKTTEKRVESKEHELALQVHTLELELAAAKKDSSELQSRHARVQDQLDAAERVSTAKLDTAEQKREKLKLKCRQQVAALRAECEALAHELEAHRAAARTTKWQSAQQASENEALRRQLGAVKGDVENLTAALEQQKEAAQVAEQRQIRCKKQLKQSELALQQAARRADELQSELVLASEALVRKNASVETLQSELRAAKAQSEQQRRELDEHRSRIKELSAQIVSLETQRATEKCKADEAERVRTRLCRKELQQMRQLLAVSHQKATESSRDVHALKQELFSVQEVLHDYRSSQDSWRKYIRTTLDDEDARDDDEQQQQQTAELRAASRAEESVLKCAIMEEVAAAAATLAVPEMKTTGRSRSTKKRPPT